MPHVGREYSMNAIALCDVHDCGVGEVEPLVGVSCDNRLYPEYIARSQLGEAKLARAGALEQHRDGAGPGAKEIGRIRDDRPNGEERPGKRFRRRDTSGVMLIVRTQQRDERPRVD